MSNNKFIFQEQQKMAIKLNNCLEMTSTEFMQAMINNNQKLKEAFAKNPKYEYEPVLPKPDSIYRRQFHFLNETLLEKEERIEQRRLKKLQKQNQQNETEQNEASTAAESQPSKTD